MLDIKEYLKQTRTVLVTQDAFDELVKKASAEPERKKPDHGYMWICPECGLEVHSDFSQCVRCGWCRLSAERKKGEL